ncbi:C-type lectin-like isoform X2 [Paralichthys olivaceus]|uniref:C-type lectin-like isoform X2 n=1 Tax=Paralichthys olivaceus TaxID=8255 RepID=UPI003750F103
MEVIENSGREFDCEFEAPIYQEDMHDEDECPPQPNSNENRQQDSNLKDTHLTADDAERIEIELKGLHDTYKTAIKTMKDTRHELDKEMTRQTPSNWELEHQQKRKSDNEEQIDQMTVAIASMKFQLPILRESCRLCPTGWVLMNSVCYYFAFSNVDGTKTWKRARNFCQDDGGDLVIMDSKDKVNLTVNALRNYYTDSTSPSSFWIGLNYIHEEETWKWLNGTSLAEGYWDDGEPTVSGTDACANVYPKQNFFKSWSSTLCNEKKKWICEKAPIIIS